MSEERVGKCPKGSVLIVPPEMEKIGLSTLNISLPNTSWCPQDRNVLDL